MAAWVSKIRLIYARFCTMTPHNLFAFSDSWKKIHGSIRSCFLLIYWLIYRSEKDKHFNLLFFPYSVVFHVFACHMCLVIIICDIGLDLDMILCFGEFYGYFLNSFLINNRRNIQLYMFVRVDYPTVTFFGQRVDDSWSTGHFPGYEIVEDWLFFVLTWKFVSCMFFNSSFSRLIFTLRQFPLNMRAIGAKKLFTKKLLIAQ